MDMLTRIRSHIVRLICILTVLFLTSLACSRSGQSAASIWSISEYQPSPTPDSNNPSSNPSRNLFCLRELSSLPGRRARRSRPLRPTCPHPLPAMRTEARQHTVKAGETLGTIAKQYGVGVQQLVEVNKLANPDFLQAGWTLQIPAPTPAVHGLAFKIIPDSELVYSLEPPISIPPGLFRARQAIWQATAEMPRERRRLERRSWSGRTRILGEPCARCSLCSNTRVAG